MGYPRTRWFSQVLEYLRKRGDRWQGIEKKRLLTPSLVHMKWK
jgi:hypothetical protein